MTRRSRGEGVQGTDAFVVEGLQRRVAAGVQGGGFFPHGSLGRPPAGPFPDLDFTKARRGQPGMEADPAQPVRHPFVVWVHGFPAGQHHPSAGRQDPAQFAVGSVRARSELDGVHAQRRAGRAGPQPRRGEVSDVERRCPAELPGLLAGLVYRLGGEVDSDQRAPVRPATSRP